MQTLGSVAVGSIVKIKENGSPVDFYVAKHDYESGLNGAGRTLVVRKDTYDDRVWDSGNVNAYASSDLDSWFNSSYKNMLDADIRSRIGTTKIRYTPGNGNNTVGTLERAIFALSLTELGQSPTYANTEGSALPIASTLRIAYRNGSVTTQWTRSPYTNGTSSAWGLNSSGNADGSVCNGSDGSRPAFTLPGATLYVDDSGNITTNQPPTAPGTITVPSAGSKGGSLTVSWTASTDPDGNLSGYTLQRMVDSGSWTQIYQGANTSFTDTLPATASAVQYRVQAYDAAGATSDWTTSSSVPVYGSPKLTVPIQAMQGQQVSVSWTEIPAADSYILQRKASTDSDFTQVYAGEALTYSETAGTWTSVQYRVCAVFGSTNGEWATSGSVPVVSASALVVSGSDGDLGTLTSDVQYTVSSDGTNPITVEEEINGTSRTFTAANGGTNVIPVVDLPTGTGTITIKATTQATAGEVSVTRSWTYAKDAPVFSDAGSLAQLTQQGENIFPKTIAEAVRVPTVWGNNLGIALQMMGANFKEIGQKIDLIMQNVAQMTLTVQDSGGHPIQGVQVSGIFDENGDVVETNASGQAVGYVSEGNSTISISGYADIENYSEQITAVKGEVYTKDITVNTRNFLKITSTQNVKFSGNVTRVDVSVGGGGGGGSGAPNNTTNCGRGGGGGYSEIQEDVDFTPNTTYQAIIGAGGARGSNGSNESTSSGKDGGSSSFLGVSAPGGAGAKDGAAGTGNGNGGNESAEKPAGNPGTTNIYTSFTEQSLYGGGGGSGLDIWLSDTVPTNGYAGGSPGGGAGGDVTSRTSVSPAKQGTDGLGGGGGGASIVASGSSSRYQYTKGNANKGGAGVVAIRMHLASAA